MYAIKNFRTKKELKQAVWWWRNQDSGNPPPVGCYQPGPFGPDVADGEHTCEGPHYPEAHRWYARVKVVANRIVKVVS